MPLRQDSPRVPPAKPRSATRASRSPGRWPAATSPTGRTPQRSRAAQHGVPRPTLRDWVARQRALASEAEFDGPTVAFLTSPPGEAFLRRLVLAAHLVFHQQGNRGLRPLMRWMELTTLNRFVGASYGPTRDTSAATQALLGHFAGQEKERLGKGMKPRLIPVVADENFHDESGPCRLACEPAPNFLLVQGYAADRTAATRQAALGRALDGLPVSAG